LAPSFGTPTAATWASRHLPRPRFRTGQTASVPQNPVPQHLVEAIIESSVSRQDGPATGGFAIAIATAGGAGYAPVAPGTFGSMVGVAVFLAFADLGLLLFGITLISLTFLGVWASDAAEKFFGQKDDGRIVIDEVVGQLLTLAPLAALAPGAGRRAPLWLLGGFLLFRLLDIWKPPPIRWAERTFPGGAGVMLDDVFAGILGGLAMAAALLWFG
jgi:phosphatidylglycerophosphatase A